MTHDPAAASRDPRSRRRCRAKRAAADDLRRTAASLAWIAAHLDDLHELAWGIPGSSPDVTVQAHTDSDVGNRLGIIPPKGDRHLTPKPGMHADRRIGTPAQQAWRTTAGGLHRASRALNAICEVTLYQPGRTGRPRPLPGTTDGVTESIRRAIRATRDIATNLDPIGDHPDHRLIWRTLRDTAALVTSVETSVSKLFAGPDSRPDLDRHHLPAPLAGTTIKAARRRRARGEHRPTQLEHGGLDCRCPRCQVAKP